MRTDWMFDQSTIQHRLSFFHFTESHTYLGCQPIISRQDCICPYMPDVAEFLQPLFSILAPCFDQRMGNGLQIGFLIEVPPRVALLGQQFSDSFTDLTF